MQQRELMKALVEEMKGVLSRYESAVEGNVVATSGAATLINTIDQQCNTPNGVTQWKFIRLGLRSMVGGRPRHKTAYSRTQSDRWSKWALEASGATPSEILEAMDKYRLGLSGARRDAA